MRWPPPDLVLQREQHLSALDGLAAAAAHELGTPLATITVVAKEMEQALGNDPIGSARTSPCCARQSERCREILKRLTSLSTEKRRTSGAAPLTVADRGGRSRRTATSASPSAWSRASDAAGRGAGRPTASRASSTGWAIWSRARSTFRARA